MEAVVRMQPPTVKILLVDDLPENLLALSALLRGSAVELLEARSGTEALELLLVHDVALALIDVQMPGMDGFELAEVMRGNRRTSGVPIVFVTAGSRDEQRLFKGYDAGAVDFLYKPIDSQVLKSKVGVFIELAQQKALLAQELQARTRTLHLNEMFTAMLGHDLRGPLSVIVLNATMQLRRAADDAQRKSAVRNLDSARRMSRMIADMLDLSRARLGGGIPIQRDRMDLGDLVEQTIDGFRQTAPGRQIDCGRSGTLLGDWDADRLSQMVSNLLANALQHGAPDTPITCRVDGSQGNEVRFSVSNGGAIPPARVANLFDPFRDGGAHRGRSDGLGLGLYIVEQIALAHGGRVELETGDPASTTFTVRLPRTA